ncbi:MAG: host attachment protein [Gammaproteobacteria bacterium]|nr:host attachment protein [Gammaproteobacteria bacterium]
MTHKPSHAAGMQSSLMERTLMPHTTWILVAHRAGARLYSQSGKHQPLHLVENIPHPEGRLRNRDLDSDAGGRSFDRFGPQRHALSPKEAPIDHVTDLFAKELANKLHSGRANGNCEQIILVAGPRLLGKLRSRASRGTGRCRHFRWLQTIENEGKQKSYFLLPVL